MTELSLTLAIGDYLHTMELARGRAKPVGIDLNVLNVPFETGVMRFTKTYEYDLSEISLANYCAIIARSETPPIVGIPVFPSRAFRHSSIYINERSGIKRAEDLRGRKVGIPQWSQTALVYVRGFLTHGAGVPLESIQWFQAGVDEAGRKESVTIDLPPGVTLTSLPTKSLSEMLAAGELDAIISARPPASFLRGEAGVARLFPNYRQVEEEYLKTTGIFPIMHMVAIRREVYEKNRWIIRSLFDAFQESKDIAMRRLTNIQFSHIPTLWGADDALRARQMLPSGDLFPYGIEPNRATLEPFLGYCFEQGVTSRLLTPEDLFAPEIRFELKV
jgi:4,5-dihydroxyphthalate decarboxylase